MSSRHYLSNIVLLGVLLISGCVPSLNVTQTQTPAPTATAIPSPTPRPEKNVALLKPVRVSASWVVDPPERAVNGNPSDWWGAGGPAPQWIEVDLQGVYPVSKINVTVEGPTEMTTYKILGRGPHNANALLYGKTVSVFKGQTLQFSPEKPLEGISTIRLEIDNSGSGWVGIRELQVFSREDPKPLPVIAEETPLYLAGVSADKLGVITKDNAIFMKPLAMFGRGPVNDVTWSKDGATLAVASPLGVWLYDSADLKSTPRLLEGHTRDVLAVAFSPDGKFLLSGSQDGTVKKWDVGTGELLQTMYLWNDFKHEVGQAPRDPEVWSIAFTADGTRVATGAFDGTLRLWDLDTGKSQTYPEGHTRQISHLAFSPDGSLLASSAVDGSLLVWDTKTSTQRKDLSGQGQVQTLAFSPDSSILAYGGTKMNVQLWDTSTGEEIDELKEHGDVINLAFAPDGSVLVISDLKGSLQVWDVESRASAVLNEKVGWATNLAISPDGSTVATTMYSGVLQLWEMTNGNQKDVLIAHTSPINSVAFSPDGKIVASGGDDGITWLWNIEKNSIYGALLGHRGRVTGVTFSPDGKLIATSSFDRTVRVWNARTLQPVDVLSGHESFVRCVVFSPDGKTIASGSTDRVVRLWDVATGKEVAVLKGHGGEVEGLAFSPDGAWLASGSADKTIRIWDVAAQKEVGVLTGNLSFVNGIDFHPAGNQLVTAGADHSLRFWDWHVSAGKGAGLQRPVSRGHPGWILSVKYSPDGRLIASANLSSTSFYVTPGEIHLYSSDTAYPYGLLRGHTKRVTSVAFSNDGKMLASGSADGSVRIWGVSLEDAGRTPQPATITPTEVTPPSMTASWEDKFDGSLAQDWFWNKEEPDKWNLTEKPGFLRIYASPYQADGTNSNQLLRSVPEGDFVITTHVRFEPKTNFQFAGLIIFQDDNNILSFGRAFCDNANVCVGNGIYFDHVQDGKWIGSNYATPVNNTNEAYLRLQRQGKDVKAFFSYDGNDWFEIGAHAMPSNFHIKGIGLMAVGDYDKSDEDIPADFDFFELSTDQPVVTVATPSVPLNLPTSGNLALNQKTSTSNSEVGRPSNYAVDGKAGTDWGSGAFPPQWIEIDLGAPATVTVFRLLVTQYPSGTTVHRILVRSVDGEFTEVHKFEQFTSTGQWLVFRLPQPMENVQIVRIETVQSPSWIGWIEVEVIGER